LKTTKEFGYSCAEWEDLPVPKKEKLIAHLRDEYDIQRVSLLPEDKLSGLGGALGWVRVE